MKQLYFENNLFLKFSQISFFISFFLFWLHSAVCGILVSQQGPNLGHGSESTKS